MEETQINGKIFCAHELEELTWLKCPYDLKQSTDLVQSLSKYQEYFSQKLNKKKIQNLYGTTKDLKQPKQSREKGQSRRDHTF